MTQLPRKSFRPPRFPTKRRLHAQVSLSTPHLSVRHSPPSRSPIIPCRLALLSRPELTPCLALRSPSLTRLCLLCGNCTLSLVFQGHAIRDCCLFHVVCEYIELPRLGRRQLLSQTLSSEESVNLWRECIAWLVSGNLLQGLDVIMRHPSWGGLVGVDVESEIGPRRWMRPSGCTRCKLPSQTWVTRPRKTAVPQIQRCCWHTAGLHRGPRTEASGPSKRVTNDARSQWLIRMI